MSEGQRRFRLLIAILCAFVLHAALGSYVEVRGARPNLALTTTLVSCLFVGANSSAVLGLFLGLLEASYTPRYVGSVLVSRAVGCWLVGMLEQLIFRDTLPVALTTALAGTFVVEGLLFLFAPQPHAAVWAIHTGLECAMNAGLSIPLYFVLHRIAARRD